MDAARRLRHALGAWRRLARRAPSIGRFAGIAPASGPFRCWLAEVEDAVAIASGADRLLRVPARDRREHPGWSALVDLVADAGVLATLAPYGRIPSDFAARARRLALERLAVSVRKLRALPEAPARDGRGPEVGPVLVERRLTIVESGRDPAFERRVSSALALLDRAWPSGASMVRARTWRVVPVTAWATVSYSSARQPGVVYINVNSAPLLRLAEDLVHETTHARVHELEALRPLVAARARESSAGDEPRFYSPWRREWRPLRGLVHAACTFTAGALFFERMLAASEPGASCIVASPARRRWLARRLLEERASVTIALSILRRAGRSGLLTRSGRRVVDAAAREHRGLGAAASSRLVWLRTTRAGRTELAKVDRLLAALERQPVRWDWEDERGLTGASGRS
jgi:HEXXH motif-containing protein